MERSSRLGRALAGLFAVSLLAGCTGEGFQQDYLEPGTGKGNVPHWTSEKQPETIFGDSNGLDLLNMFGGKDGTGGGGIGVNSFLWRASLDTISFMPLSSADPFGGVIITDWYSPPETPAERFKMNIYILGRQLRADGIRVAVFRQSRKDGGPWSDAAVGKETAANLENQILTRARQLRVASASAK